MFFPVWKLRHRIQVLYVDYLQLVNPQPGSKNTREAEVSTVSRGLKALAKELDIPVVALASLNRDVENRQPPIPRLADLRDSGAIESDADMVMFFYRPSYYQPTYKDADECIIAIAKHRNGRTGETNVKFNAALQTFTDYNHTDFEPLELPAEAKSLDTTIKRLV